MLTKNKQIIFFIIFGLVFAIWLIFLLQQVSVKPIVKNVVHPYSIAIDEQNGDVYFTETETNKIFKFDIRSNETNLYKDLSFSVKKIGTIAFNAKRELFATDINLGKIFKISEEGGVEKFTSNLSIPFFDIGFDKDDNLIVMESGIIKMLPNGRKTNLVPNYTMSVFGAIQTADNQDVGLNMRKLIQGAQGMVFDNKGNFYISNTLFDNLIKVDSNGEIYVIYSHLLSQPRGITVDDKNNLYVANTYRGNEAGYIVKITPSGKIIKITDTLHDLSHAEQLKWNKANGKIYAAAFGAKAVLEIGNLGKNFNPFGKKISDKTEIIKVAAERTRASREFQEKYNIAYNPAESNRAITEKITSENPHFQKLSQDKEVIFLFPETGILNEWEISTGKASGLNEVDVRFENGDIKKGVNIITTQGKVVLSVKYKGDGEGYGLAKHYYAAKPFKLSFWIKASEPGCARGGVYRGNTGVMSWSYYNSFGPEKGYELIKMQNWFDKNYTLNGNVFFGVENNCEVEIVNPVLNINTE